MPRFTYTALDKEGERRPGTIDAPNEKRAKEFLSERGLVVIGIAPMKEPTKLEDVLAKYRDIKPDVLVYFTRQLATMVESGMSLVISLQTLAEQDENPKFAEILEQVSAKVEAGSELYKAFAEHPKVFDDLYVAMVRAGEESGSLPDALKELAQALEKQASLRKAVKSATMYPKVISIMALLVLSGLLLTIVPTFANIFKETVASTYDPSSGEPPPSTDLPALTQFFLDLSHLLYPDRPKSLSWFGEVLLRFFCLFLLIFGIKKGIRYILSQPGPRSRWDAFKLRAPMRIGGLIQKIVVARFARTFSSLLRSGIQAVDALPIAADTAGNAIVADALMKAQQQMLAGGTIYEPLERSGAFPIIVTRMIKIGEESGQLQLMLLKVAEFYEEEVDLQVKGLTSLLEPLMIIVLGAIIGVVIIACYMPMFEIYNKI